MLGLNNPCFHLAPNRASAPMDVTYPGCAGWGFPDHLSTARHSAALIWQLCLRGLDAGKRGVSGGYL